MKRSFGAAAVFLVLLSFSSLVLAGEQWTPIGDVVSVKADDSSADIVLTNARVTVTAYTDHILRVRVTRAREFGEDRSFALYDGSPKPSAIKVTEEPSRILIHTAALTAEVGKKPFSVKFMDQDGKVISEDAGPAIGFSGTEIQANKVAPASEHYFGFGEKTGHLDKRGMQMEMWNTDTTYGVNSDPIYQSNPFFLALREGRAYGYFFDNPNHSYFDMADTDQARNTYRAVNGDLNYYFIAGPAPADVISRYTSLVGRMPLPPLWGLGYQQNRYSYWSEEWVRDIARNFRERRIPCDVIYLDIHYMSGYRVFTFDYKRFPDPKKMIADLGQDGFKIIVIVDPGVKAEKGYPMYDQGVKGDYFLKDAGGKGYYEAHVWPGKCNFPDFTKPQVRQWWGDAHKFYTDLGIAGIWNDMNEIAGWGPDINIYYVRVPVGKKPDWDAVAWDQGRDSSFYNVKNVYALLENQATYEGLLRLRPDKRPYIISRSGFSGLQRYAGMWTGDNTASWSHLAITSPMLQNINTSGIPINGADIGGFIGNPTPELYARWIEQGSFYTYSRTHTAIFMPPQEPWRYGKDVEDISRNYLSMRYQLLPYTYSVAEENTRTGVPIMRSMYIEFPDDERVLDNEQAYMWGPSLMIVPIIKKGQKSIDVYLPKAGWYDYHTKKRVGNGPTTLADFPAPLSTMPIFVREGAIIPHAPVMNYTGEKPVDPLVLEVYPGAAGSFSLYEDAGNGFGYKNGEFARTEFSQSTDKDKIHFTVKAREGSFKVPERTLKIGFLDVPRPANVTVTNKSGSAADAKWSYNEDEAAVTVEFPDKGAAAEVNVLLQ